MSRGILLLRRIQCCPQKVRTVPLKSMLKRETRILMEWTSYFDKYTMLCNVVCLSHWPYSRKASTQARSSACRIDWWKIQYRMFRLRLSNNQYCQSWKSKKNAYGPMWINVSNWAVSDVIYRIVLLESKECHVPPLFRHSTHQRLRSMERVTCGRRSLAYL